MASVFYRAPPQEACDEAARAKYAGVAAALPTPHFFPARSVQSCRTLLAFTRTIPTPLNGVDDSCDACNLVERRQDVLCLEANAPHVTPPFEVIPSQLNPTPCTRQNVMSWPRYPCVLSVYSPPVKKDLRVVRTSTEGKERSCSRTKFLVWPRSPRNSIDQWARSASKKTTMTAIVMTTTVHRDQYRDS